VHDVAEPDEVEELGQAPVHAVEQEPTSAPGHGDVKPCQRVHRVEIGRHQPRNIQVHELVHGGRRRHCCPGGPGATTSPALVHVVRHPQRSLLSSIRALRKEPPPWSKLVTAADDISSQEVSPSCSWEVPVGECHTGNRHLVSIP
jgi:hypothetical protein